MIRRQRSIAREGNYHALPFNMLECNENCTNDENSSLHWKAWQCIRTEGRLNEYTEKVKCI